MKKLPIRMSFAVLASTALFAVLAPAQARGQFPEDYKNLKVLPKTTTKKELLGTMKGFAIGLGVRCTHCHVGVEGADFSTFDFASDERPPKELARQMLKMVRDLNANTIAKLNTGREKRLEVQCATCHRGKNIPPPYDMPTPPAPPHGAAPPRPAEAEKKG